MEPFARNRMREKTKAERAQECVQLWKKLVVELGIPVSTTGMSEIKQQINEFIKTGHPWFGKIALPAFGRVAEITLPIRVERAAVLNLRAV